MDFTSEMRKKKFVKVEEIWTMGWLIPSFVFFVWLSQDTLIWGGAELWGVFPGISVVKNPPASAGEVGSIPGLKIR